MHKVRQAPRGAPCTLLLLCQPSLASPAPTKFPLGSYKGEGSTLSFGLPFLTQKKEVGSQRLRDGCVTPGKVPLCPASPGWGLGCSLRGSAQWASAPPKPRLKSPNGRVLEAQGSILGGRGPSLWRGQKICFLTSHQHQLGGHSCRKLPYSRLP